MNILHFCAIFKKFYRIKSKTHTDKIADHFAECLQFITETLADILQTFSESHEDGVWLAIIELTGLDEVFQSSLNFFGMNLVELAGFLVPYWNRVPRTLIYLDSKFSVHYFVAEMQSKTVIDRHFKWSVMEIHLKLKTNKQKFKFEFLKLSAKPICVLAWGNENLLPIHSKWFFFLFCFVSAINTLSNWIMLIW